MNDQWAQCHSYISYYVPFMHNLLTWSFVELFCFILCCESHCHHFVSFNLFVTFCGHFCSFDVILKLCVIVLWYFVHILWPVITLESLCCIFGSRCCNISNMQCFMLHFRLLPPAFRRLRSLGCVSIGHVDSPIHTWVYLRWTLSACILIDTIVAWGLRSWGVVNSEFSRGPEGVTSRDVYCPPSPRRCLAAACCPGLAAGARDDATSRSAPAQTRSLRSFHSSSHSEHSSHLCQCAKRFTYTFPGWLRNTRITWHSIKNTQ